MGKRVVVGDFLIYENKSSIIITYYLDEVHRLLI